MKEHNADYLSNEAIRWHPRFGIHAANVAPEFGYTETQAIINLANMASAHDLIEILVEKVNSLGKWRKWMLENSDANELDRALISGHYHFSENWHIEWRSELRGRLKKINIDLDNYIYQEVKSSINRYLIGFGYAS